MAGDRMNVLLTGGTGYIASHTAVVLIGAGHRVVLFDNLANSRLAVIDHLESITGQRLPFINGDVRDTGLLAQTLREYAIDAVIHFAGAKAVGESVEKPIDYYANNVQGTINLLQAMQSVGVKTLVFSSSATVYGNPQHLPIDEEHPLSATNPYGRTKLHVEEMLADAAVADPSWRLIRLRYFNPVGAHESGLIGEDPNGIPNNLVPYIARVANGQLPYLSVHGDDYPTPDGTGVRDYIHVMDLADGHLAALASIASRPAGLSTFNLGTGRGYSVIEVVRAYEAASGRPVPYRVGPRRPGDVATCYAKADRAAQELGWKSKRDLAEMCASSWRFQCSRVG